jgi:hypothetical protein
MTPDHDDILPAEWARQGVERFDRAVREWNDQYPENKPVRLIWGFRDREEADRERNEPSGSPIQRGLLCYQETDVEV